MDEKLLKNLSRLGFPLMEREETFDANETLARVVRSKETRLWEGFPVLLANAGERHLFDYDSVVEKLGKGEEREDFHALVLLSLALYRHYHISFAWAGALEKRFSSEDVAEMKYAKNALAQSDVATVKERRFDSSRLKETFNNYFEKNMDETRKLSERHEALSLEYALSQLFSPKQKELFKKRLAGELLTKTEKEYYSRTVKKKVSALANSELHRLAQRLMKF